MPEVRWPQLPALSKPHGLDWAPAEVVDHPVWQRVALAYDPGEDLNWPRQRSHFVFSRELDGWQIVAQFHSFDGYRPDRDHIESAELVGVVVQPAILEPWQFHEAQSAEWNYAILDPAEAFVMTEDGPEAEPISHTEVGHRPEAPPSAELFEMMTPEALSDAGNLVVEASQMVADTDYFRGWYRLPTPTSTPTKRGRGGRNVREWAELAVLYVHAAEVDPTTPVKWLSQEFAYTGRPSSWWAGIGGDLARWGFIEGREHGRAGATLTQRTHDEIAAHRR